MYLLWGGAGEIVQLVRYLIFPQALLEVIPESRIKNKSLTLPGLAQNQQQK